MTTTAPNLRQRADAVAALVTAFSTDPILRWVFPDAPRYLVAFPEVVELMGGQAFEAGTAELADGGCGVALWLAPGTPLDDAALGGLVESHVDASRRAAVFEMLEQMDAHHPDVDVWYLPFIGIDPAHQGRGHGSHLVGRGVARADHDGLPAYLEASSPRNRRLYERHGFEVVGEIQAGDSPSMWPMLRSAR